MYDLNWLTITNLLLLGIVAGVAFLCAVGADVLDEVKRR